jgi:iron complex outermembrane recepter protein
MKSLKIGVGFAALQAFGSFCGQAQAQEESDTLILPSITVTAQRRTEDVQKAALSITAVSGKELESRGIDQTEALGTLTAGLEVSTSAGPYAIFSIRSVSALSGNAFADPAVAVNINGVYLATPTVLHGLYYDLERVEILKGPQGTLYGRNATAGAINIIPARPTFTFGGNASMDVGDYHRFNVAGALNVPLSSTLAFRIAGQRLRRDGYMSDGTNDDDGEAIRASLLFLPSDDLSILLTGDYARQGGKGPGATIRKTCASLSRPGGGVCFVADPYTGVADLPEQYVPFGIAPQPHDTFVSADYYGSGLNVDWTTALGTVSFVGGYRGSRNSYKGSGTSWLLLEQQRPTQESAELRLASSSQGPFQYVFGTYYLHTDMHAHANGENPTRGNFSDQRTNLSGWTGAAFSQLTYGLTDTFRLVGGARYTYEEKSSNSRRYTVSTVGPNPVIPVSPVGNPTNVVVGSRNWDKVNWKAGVEYDVAPRTLLYANVSTGFKAGGFFYGPPGADSYDPEEVTSYVLGVKNRLLDNRLQLNAEGFYLNYRNQQVSFVKLVGTSATLVTENAGTSHAYGFEVEGDYLATQNTRIGLQLQNLEARYDSFSYLTVAPPPSTSSCHIAPRSGQFSVDCSGNTPTRSPQWTILGSLEQTVPLPNGGRLIGEAQARYETRFQSDVSYIPEAESYATTRVNLGLSYVTPDDRFTIKAYVDNLTNETTIANATVSVAYSLNHVVGINVEPPRTYGVRATLNF